MTIYEKIAALNVGCTSRDRCTGCPLEHFEECEFSRYNSAEIDARYQLMFPEKTIKIKYFDPDLDPVVFKGDWCDLRSAEDVDMKAGEFRLIRLGVGMILPDGYEAHIVPRSSTYKNYGVIQTNHMGVIDNKYSGDDDEWLFPAYALRDTHISKNDRICQFRIMENQPDIIFETVEHLNEESRGGLGSTGKR